MNTVLLLTYPTTDEPGQLLDGIKHYAKFSIRDSVDMLIFALSSAGPKQIIYQREADITVWALNPPNLTNSLTRQLEAFEFDLTALVERNGKAKRLFPSNTIPQQTDTTHLLVMLHGDIYG